MYCLQPPLTVVPPGDWFCPACTATRTAVPTQEAVAMDVDDEPLSTAPIRIKQERARSMASSNGDSVDPEPSPNAAISIGARCPESGILGCVLICRVLYRRLHRRLKTISKRAMNCLSMRAIAMRHDVPMRRFVPSVRT